MCPQINTIKETRQHGYPKMQMVRSQHACVYYAVSMMFRKTNFEICADVRKLKAQASSSSCTERDYDIPGFSSSDAEARRYGSAHPPVSCYVPFAS